jgi:hypothetical protein
VSARRGRSRERDDLAGPEVRVEALGPDGEIAGVRVPLPALERLVGTAEAANLAGRLRELGFRHVAVDLDPAP